MKTSILFSALLLFASAHSIRAEEFFSGMAADVVLGQSDFTSSNATPVESRFYQSQSVAVDPTTGKVFVGDSGHHRILRYAAIDDVVAGAVPEAVFGQANLSSVAANQGGRSERTPSTHPRKSMSMPSDVSGSRTTATNASCASIAPRPLDNGAGALRGPRSNLLHVESSS